MNRTLIVLTLLALVGCTQTKYIVKPELVEVKLPVPYCPPAEEIAPMPPIELETLKLTEADKKEPGKVARAYEIDMIALTQRQSELDRIEAARKQQAETLRVELDKYRDEVARIHKENMNKVQQEVVDKQKALNHQ